MVQAWGKEFTTSVDDVVVIVTDPNHGRFGRIGKLVAHDWTESGDYHVRFSDGRLKTLILTEKQANTYLRTTKSHNIDQWLKSGCGPLDFAKRFLEMNNGDFARLKKEYGEIVYSDLDMSILNEYPRN